MRKNQINGLIHDLLNLESYINPLDREFVDKRFEVSLLKNEISGNADDEGTLKFYQKKIKWFKNRVKKLGGLKDFQEAKIFVYGSKEKIKIIFKGEEFSGEKVFGQTLEEMEKRFNSYEKSFG